MPNKTITAKVTSQSFTIFSVFLFDFTGLTLPVRGINSAPTGLGVLFSTLTFSTSGKPLRYSGYHEPSANYFAVGCSKRAKENSPGARGARTAMSNKTTTAKVRALPFTICSVFLFDFAGLTLQVREMNSAPTGAGSCL